MSGTYAVQVHVHATRVGVRPSGRRARTPFRSSRYGRRGVAVQDGLRPGLAVTAPLPQISLRLARYCPHLTSRLSRTMEPDSAPQSQFSALDLQAANGGRTRDLKLGRFYTESCAPDSA